MILWKYDICSLGGEFESTKKPQKRHNFADTLLSFADTLLRFAKVFYFNVLHFVTNRATLPVKVIEILQRKNLNHLGNQPELYLYGHQPPNLTDNRDIFSATIKYIKDTQRFSA